MTLLQAPSFDTQFSTELWQAEVVSPLARYFSALDKTLITWFAVGADGHKNAYVAAYDHATETWSERYVLGNYLLANDLHGMTALEQDADGYFYCLYGSHATAQQWSISTAPNDFTRWTQQTPIPDLQTYPHPVRVGSTIYSFWREDIGAVNRYSVVRSMTPSGGAGTWSAQKRIIDFDTDSRVYHSGAYAVGTDIHIVVTRSNAADSEDRNLYYLRYDTTNGAVKNHDASVSVASGSQPIPLSTLNSSYRIYTTPVGQQNAVPSFCIDAAGDPHIAFFEGPSGNGQSHSILHITRTAGVWSSTFTVATGITDLVDNFSFVSVMQVLPGPSGSVEVWFCPNNGSKMRRVRSSGGTWSAPETILSKVNGPLVANLAVRDAHPDFRVAFAEWTANIGQAALDSNAILSKRYAFGDRGMITAQVPSAPIDPSFASNSILLGFESRDGLAGFVNDAPAALLVTANGNAQADTAQSKFGSASLLLDGSGDFLSLAHNSRLSVGGGNMTFECWVKRTASKMQAICTKRTPANNSEFACWVLASNVLQFAVWNTPGTVVVIIGSSTVTTGWHHVAVSRAGSTWRVFLDGNLEGQATESATPVGNTEPLLIGRDASVFPARDFDGWIDEFRLTSGVARYTAGFTPPAAAFPRR